LVFLLRALLRVAGALVLLLRALLRVAGALVLLLRALPRVMLWMYFLFSLTPVRGGTYFLCFAKESKQRKALHTANPK
jgi:hypothetical protein